MVTSCKNLSKQRGFQTSGRGGEGTVLIASQNVPRNAETVKNALVTSNMEREDQKFGLIGFEVAPRKVRVKGLWETHSTVRKSEQVTGSKRLQKGLKAEKGDSEWAHIRLEHNWSTKHVPESKMDT
jgi:hypothetical protein